MIDFHSHILPGLDDGIATFDEALVTVREAKKAGFDKIIATTHYYTGDNFIANEEERKTILEKLNENISGIEIILGNEIYINGHIDELIQNKDASTINNSKYILFEIPLQGEYQNLKNVIFDLISKGYKLILAHPERYKIFQEDPRKLEEIVDLGVYLQANYLSIIGFYGKDAQRTVELLYKHDMISFIGTDVHKANRYYSKVGASIDKIVSIIGDEKFEELSSVNPEAVIRNEEIDIADYFPIEKGLFGKYK